LADLVDTLRIFSSGVDRRHRQPLAKIMKSCRIARFVLSSRDEQARRRKQHDRRVVASSWGIRWRWAL